MNQTQTLTVTDPTDQLLQGPHAGIEESFYAHGIGIMLIDHVREDASGRGNRVLFEHKELTSLSGLTAN